MKTFFSLLDEKFDKNADNDDLKIGDQLIKDFMINELLETFIHDYFRQKAVLSRIKSFSVESATILYRQTIINDLINNDELFKFWEQFREDLDALKDLYSMTMFEKNESMKSLKTFLVIEQFIYMYNNVVNNINNIDKISKNDYSQLMNNIIDEFKSEQNMRIINEMQPIVMELRNELNTIRNIKLNRYFYQETNVENSISKKNLNENASLMDRLSDLANKLGYENEIQLSRMTKMTRPEALNNIFYSAILSVHSDIFNKIENFHAKYEDMFDKSWFNIINEIDSVLGFAEFFKNIKNMKMPVCAVKMSENGDLTIKNLYNILLVIKGLNTEQIIPNDVIIEDNKRFSILTGPNAGGKTIFLMSVGIAQLFFQASGWIVAESGKMMVVNALYTHFPAEEKNEKTGRLGEEIARIEEITNNAKDGSMILLNEIFSSTKNDVAMELLSDLLIKLANKSIYGILITHFHELTDFINEFNVDKTNKIGQLAAMIDENEQGKRTYKILPVNMKTSSYSHDILLKYKLTKEQLFSRIEEANL